jgi:hypothetical protein
MPTKILLQKFYVILPYNIRFGYKIGGLIPTKFGIIKKIKISY